MLLSCGHVCRFGCGLLSCGRAREKLLVVTSFPGSLNFRFCAYAPVSHPVLCSVPNERPQTAGFISTSMFALRSTLATATRTAVARRTFPGATRSMSAETATFDLTGSFEVR